MTRSQFSPTRPIACESDWIMEMAPRSCRKFSAAMVSARIRLSVNATSDGIRGFRLCTTMIMSNSSPGVLIPNGSVGVVELGSTLSSPTTRSRSGE